MTTSPISTLEERLNAYSATVRAPGKAVLTHAADNWQSYAAVAGAALAMTTSVAAQVTYSGPQNLTASINSAGNPRFTATSNASGFHTHAQHNSAQKTGVVRGPAQFLIDVNQHCCGDYFLNGAAAVEGIGLSFLAQNNFALQKLGGNVNISTAPGNFEAGTRFLHTFAKSTAGNAFAGGLWTTGKTAFAGFRFKTGSTAGSKTDYGWIRLVFTVSPNGAPDSITAIDWAYGANGTPVTTGDIPSSTPEPATGALALLAAGAAGVIALRRRRTAV